MSARPASKASTSAAAGASAEAIYHQYADATGHAPPLRPEAMRFWQSRNRYRSTEIALAVADRYKALDLPVGVLVIDYKNQVHDGDVANPNTNPSPNPSPTPTPTPTPTPNPTQVHDGDFAPNPACYPSVQAPWLG